MTRPDGKMTDEVKKLQRATAQWCNGVRTKRLHPEEAWYSLTATILRTLEWPLVATTLTLEQCKELLKPVLKTRYHSAESRDDYLKLWFTAPIECAV
jgi:hypothetical protein